MRALPTSIYATPGVRAFGSLGLVPDANEYAGMTRACWATTPWKGTLHRNMLVWATSKLRKVGGADEVRRPFFITDLIYDHNYPDRVGVEGYWLCEGHEITLYHDTKRMRATATSPSCNDLSLIP